MTPPWYLLGLLSLLAGSFGLIFVPLSPQIAIAVALSLGLLAGLWQYLTSPVIEVADGWLRAGQARIEAQYLGAVEVLDRAQVRSAMALDLRAYSAHRDWATGGVRVQIEDPRDPAPFWLISTDHPSELAEAIRAMS